MSVEPKPATSIAEHWLIPLEGNLQTALTGFARIETGREEGADVVVLEFPSLAGGGMNVWNYLKKHLKVRVEGNSK